LDYWEPIKSDDPNPNFPGMGCNDQYGFYHSTADIQFGIGSNRSGKTLTGSAKALRYALGQHETLSKLRQPPIYGRVVAPQYEKNCKGIILKKFRQLIPHHELRGSSWSKAWSESGKLLALSNGSTISFLSSEMKLDTFAGDDLDWVWEDEPIPFSYFTEDFARLTDRKGFLMKTMTPDMGQTWEEDYINLHPPGLTVDYFHFLLEGNPYIPKDAIERFKASLVDENKLKVKFYGQFAALGGLVIPQFNHQLSVIPDVPLQKHWPKTIIADPHLKKPTALVWIAWPEPDVCFVYRTKKVKMHVGDMAQFIRSQSSADGNINLWLADEAMGGQGTNIFGSDSVIQQFNGLGLPFMPTNQSSDKAFEAGINKLQDMFSPDPITQKPSIFIFQSCIYDPEWIDGKVYGDIVWELRRYQFKKEQKSDEETFREKVRTVDDDYIDCLRYGVMAGCPSVGQVRITNPGGPADPYTGW
jgi:hypothetical protein